MHTHTLQQYQGDKSERKTFLKLSIMLNKCDRYQMQDYLNHFQISFKTLIY